MTASALKCLTRAALAKILVGFLGRFSLCLLEFLLGFALVLAGLLQHFLLFLGVPAGSLRVLIGRHALSRSGNGAGDAQGGQQEEGGDSFHNVSDGVLH
jgi:hypothetical protein